MRQRGAPLDLIVAEAMILANSTWGGWLAELGVPGIYRSQASLAPGVKVRMGTKAAAARRHRRQELRLEHLAAAPLHRPGEPVADHRRARATAAPPRWPRRSSPRTRSCSRSSPASTPPTAAYNGFQAGMERYWTLQYLRAATASRELDGHA